MRYLPEEIRIESRNFNLPNNFNVSVASYNTKLLSLTHRMVWHSCPGSGCFLQSDSRDPGTLNVVSLPSLSSSLSSSSSFSQRSEKKNRSWYVEGFHEPGLKVVYITSVSIYLATVVTWPYLKPKEGRKCSVAVWVWWTTSNLDNLSLYI